MYKICGVIGLLGCFAVIAGDIIGIMVHEAHDPIGNTISMLAIGKYGWIQDLGLDFLALGFVAVAVGLFTWKRSGVKWIFGLVFLTLIAIDLIFIAEHNQYAIQSEETIHRKLVYALAALFPLSVFLTGFELKNLKPYLRKFSFWVAGIWLILAPFLPLIPDSLEGAYERLVCSLIVIWLGTVSFHLFKLSR